MNREDFERNSEWVSEMQKLMYIMAVPRMEIDNTVEKAFDITKRLFKG